METCQVSLCLHRRAIGFACSHGAWAAAAAAGGWLQSGLVQYILGPRCPKSDGVSLAPAWCWMENPPWWWYEFKGTPGAEQIAVMYVTGPCTWLVEG
jgi:hypothetical protein